MTPNIRSLAGTRAARTAALVAAALAAAGSEADEPGDLLKRPDVTIATADPAGRLDSAAALTDDDASTAAELPARGGADVDLAISWGNAAMSLRRVVIGLDPGKPALQPTDLEILVSPDADGERFSVLKSIDLFGGAGPYQYDLDPVTAKRVLVRLRAPAGGTGVRVTELSLLGQAGSAEPRPAFGESPAKAIEVVAALQGMQLDHALPAAEAAMLADGADGRFDDVSFAEAALIASGVADEAARKAQLAAIDRVVADAEQAVAGERTPLGKGEKLLHLLHGGAFKGGYELHQTDVSTVLTTGRFNCVSSAVVYTIVGRRLGLDLRGIEVPEHAFAILYDGSRHVDVETTIPEGFNPARSPEAAERFRARTGFVYVPESHREERREVNDAGLVALIYFNHGVTKAGQGDHPGALAMYFRGLYLDGTSAALVTNALAALTNWSKALLDAGKAADAAAVSRAAMRLAPRDHGIRTNAEASFLAWAIAEADAGRIDAALAALAQGLELLPHDHDLTEAKAGLFTRRAAKHIERKDWQAALDAAAPGLTKLEGRDRQRLAEWCGSVRSAWAKVEIDAGDFGAAREILVSGLEQHPDDSRVRENLEYCLDMEARRHFDRDWPAAVKAYEAALEILPGSSLLENNLAYSRQQAKKQ